MPKTKEKENKYVEAVGKRKTSIARVRIAKAAKNDISVNSKKLEEFFSTDGLINVVRSPLGTIDKENKFKITAHVKGGGMSSQAESIRHGLSRALNKFNDDLRIPLKKAGYLTRDSRKKERKKFGLKKARRAPQWSKR